MSTTSVAALVTAVVGLSACAWMFLQGRRENRMTACVLASIVVCLALVFFSIGHDRLAALEVALVIGTLGPMGTILVAVRGRGLGQARHPGAAHHPRPAQAGGVAPGRRRHAR